MHLFPCGPEACLPLFLIFVLFFKLVSSLIQIRVLRGTLLKGLLPSITPVSAEYLLFIIACVVLNARSRLSLLTRQHPISLHHRLPTPLVTGHQSSALKCRPSWALSPFPWVCTIKHISISPNSFNTARCICRHSGEGQNWSIHVQSSCVA